MFVQLALGTGLILATVFLFGLTWWGLEVALLRLHRWVLRTPHVPRLMAVMLGAVLWMMVMMTAGVWIWALTLLWLDLFPSIEKALYFALVAYTTLGFGDVLLPEEWELLSGMAAANGLLNFGFMTALLSDTLRNIRLRQRDLS